MTVTTKRPTIYSLDFDPTLEPARLAFGVAGLDLLEVPFQPQDEAAPSVTARSPNMKLPFAAANERLIAGPTSILLHAAMEAELVPTKPKRLLQATMVAEAANSILIQLRVLQRKPLSVAVPVDEETDRVMTAEVPLLLTTLEQLVVVPKATKESELDMGHLAIAALHYYLTELTDIYSPEDFANLFPKMFEVAVGIDSMPRVQKYREMRLKQLRDAQPPILCQWLL
eukprot:Protomagalhaensia_sp_Gyna_25__2782@NODE_2604_length_985_cov_613_509514_g2165_i0_p1_GENE_NODE_2604_length_985_cov_613_509514_g2165_i0NODE_2604_length_985_cov_613_509514_g2165_i0_p1_ORF_typecomplete_len227_score46_75UbiqCytcred_N/PF09165_10/0_056UbiqCytcred_N/PF09165_10/3_8e03ELFV_dehydrog/PF00208_21/0_082Cnl2_NKP2/PF09447_10/0_29_NODE_2604_length_985_cov_613_509514_g2165_i072752